MTFLSRRTFMKRVLVAGVFSAMPPSLLAAGRQPLAIPPLIELKRGKPLFLNMESTQTQLEQGKYTEVWGFNGQYLGPTVKVQRGAFAKLNYRNNLSQIVSMNIQGLQAGGELLGGIGRGFQIGELWSPILPIDQPAATCWYHACSLSRSAYQTYRGLFGMWIIEDDESRQSDLPQNYGVNDIPLILQDLQLNSEGVQLFQQNQPHFLGTRLFVNGKESPYLNVTKGWVRLRIVNASLSRTYDLRFDDEREFQVIAGDQGFLPQAKTVTSVFVAPSERIELLVNMNEGSYATLITGKKRDFLYKFKQLFNSADDLIDNTVLELRAEGMSSAFSSKPHTQFATDAVTTLSSKGIKERQFHFDTGSATINQQRFDPRRIDVIAKLGGTERWTLTADQATGFKIQGAKFVIESINEQPIEDSEKVWKDSLWINGKVQLLVKFTHPSSHNYPFTFGSSDLMLADKGCLGLIVVQ